MEDHVKQKILALTFLGEDAIKRCLADCPPAPPSFSRPLLSQVEKWICSPPNPAPALPCIPSLSPSPSSSHPPSSRYMLRPSLSSLLFPQLTLLQRLKRYRWAPRWPFGKDLGNRRWRISWCVVHVSIYRLSPPVDARSTPPGLLLFGAALTIILVTIRQRRRKLQKPQQPGYTYASHPPPGSLPYGISRVRRSPNLTGFVDP